ncbi:MAG: hypothetical protein ACM359_13950 [Bacillota bacterium]
MAILLVFGVKHDVRHVGFQIHPGHGKRCQFALAEAGQHEGLVDQGPFTAEQVQLIPHFGADVGDVLPFSLAAPDHGCFEQRALPGHGQQPRKLIFGHCAPLVSPVALGIGNRHVHEGIGDESMGAPAPIAEADQRFAVAVAGGGRHTFGLTVHKPPLQRPGIQVGEPAEAAVGPEPVKPCPHHADAPGCVTLGP